MPSNPSQKAGRSWVTANLILMVQGIAEKNYSRAFAGFIGGVGATPLAKLKTGEYLSKTGNTGTFSNLVQLPLMYPIAFQGLTAGFNSLGRIGAAISNDGGLLYGELISGAAILASTLIDVFSPEKGNQKENTTIFERLGDKFMPEFIKKNPLKYSGYLKQVANTTLFVAATEIILNAQTPGQLLKGLTFVVAAAVFTYGAYQYSKAKKTSELLTSKQGKEKRRQNLI